MKDPLVLTIPFRKRSRYGDWSGEADLFMCTQGLNEWFEVPPISTRLVVIVEPYPDLDSYPLWTRRDNLFVYNERKGWRRDHRDLHPREFVSLDYGLSQMIMDHTKPHENFNFYFSIEVMDYVKSNQRS